MLKRVVGLLVACMLTVGAICPLVDVVPVKANATPAFSSGVYSTAMTIYNLGNMGYTMTIPGEMIAPLPNGHVDIDTTMKTIDDWLAAQKVKETFPGYYLNEYNEIVPTEETLQAMLASKRQKEQISKSIQNMALQGNYTDVYVPYGISDYSNTVYRDYSATDDVNQGTIEVPIYSFNDIGLIFQSPYWDSSYEWQIRNPEVYNNACLVTQNYYTDINGVDRGMFDYLADPNLLPATPTNVYSSYTKSALPSSLYVRGGNSAVMNMIEGIDILLPDANNEIYDGSCNSLHFYSYGTGSSGGYLYSSFRSSIRNSNIYYVAPTITRDDNGTTIEKYGYTLCLGSHSQFVGPIYQVLSDSSDDPNALQFWNSIDVPGSNVTTPEELASKLCGFVCGNVHFYVGDTWADAVPLYDYSSSASVTPKEINGIKAITVPDTSDNEGSFNLTKYVEWLISLFEDNITVTDGVATVTGDIVIDNDDTDDDVYVPDGGTVTIPRTKVTPAEVVGDNTITAETTMDPDAVLPPHFPKISQPGVSGKLWSLRIHSNNEQLGDEGTMSPVDSAIGLFNLANAMSNNIFTYILAILGVFLIVGVIVRFLHG